MRKIIKEDSYAFPAIYNQLKEMDFTDFVCSPLINGGCGLGKTTALVSEEMYELFCDKLQKTKPQILVIESRAATPHRTSTAPYDGKSEYVDDRITRIFERLL